MDEGELADSLLFGDDDGFGPARRTIGQRARNSLAEAAGANLARARGLRARLWRLA
jgi:hypothetical protein